MNELLNETDININGDEAPASSLLLSLSTSSPFYFPDNGNCSIYIFLFFFLLSYQLDKIQYIMDDKDGEQLQ